MSLKQFAFNQDRLRTLGSESTKPHDQRGTVQPGPSSPPAFGMGLKRWTRRIAAIVALAAIPGAARLAQASPVLSQNFDGIAAGTTSSQGGTLSFSGFTYSTDAINDELAVDTIDNIT